MLPMPVGYDDGVVVPVSLSLVGSLRAKTKQAWVQTFQRPPKRCVTGPVPRKPTSAAFTTAISEQVGDGTSENIVASVDTSRLSSTWLSPTSCAEPQKVSKVGHPSSVEVLTFGQYFISINSIFRAMQKL